MRAVEREVRHIEAMIRQKYPGAEYIELEPMSKDADRFAIDDSFEEKLLLIEKEEMQRLIRVLYDKGSEPKALPTNSNEVFNPCCPHQRKIEKAWIRKPNNESEAKYT